MLANCSASLTQACSSGSHNSRLSIPSNFTLKLKPIWLHYWCRSLFNWMCLPLTKLGPPGCYSKIVYLKCMSPNIFPLNFWVTLPPPEASQALWLSCACTQKLLCASLSLISFLPASSHPPPSNGTCKPVSFTVKNTTGKQLMRGLFWPMVLEGSVMTGWPCGEIAHPGREHMVEPHCSLHGWMGREGGGRKVP